MNPNPLKDGVLSDHSTGLGTVTRAMVRDRAVELAAVNGRPPQEVSRTDWDQAKMELTAGPDPDPNAIAIDTAPESARWDVVHGSTGGLLAAAPGEDEDEEGRSDGERLVDEGIAAAEHDQRRAAAQAASEANDSATSGS